MIKILRVIIIGLIITIAVSPLTAQQTTVDSLFNKGVQTYENGQFRQVLEILQVLDKIYPDHNRKSSSILMQAKSYYKLKEYEEAIELFRQVQTNYPAGSYYDDAVYGEGTALYKSGDILSSVKLFLTVVEESSDKRLQLKAARLSSDIMDNEMEPEDLLELLKGVITEKSKAIVTLKLARKEILLKNFLTAKTYLQEYINRFPRSNYDENIRKLLAHAENKSAGEIILGVILPLTGETSEMGTRLLNGLKFGVAHFNKTETSQIRLIIKDSKGNIVKAIKAAQELASNGEVLAIIGELVSENTAAIAAVAQEHGIPFFAPTANMDGIAELGKYVFQLNSTLTAQAEQIAKYAILEQHHTKFALLYPATEYGKTMRTSFVKTVENLGGEIIAEKWYFQTNENWESTIGTQMQSIREAGLQRMLDDSLLIRVSSASLGNKYADIMDDAGIIGENQNLSELADSTELAVTCIDAIFMPVEENVIPYVINHLANKNIQTQIYGGTSFYNLKTLNQNKEHIDGVIFPSDYYIDDSEYDYYMMRNNFRTTMRNDPGQLEVYGYDVILLIQTLIKGKSLSRENICNALSDAKRLPVLHGVIQINKAGYNESLHLLRYRNGKFIKVK